MATTEGAAPAVPTLTLCNGGKPAAFKVLSVIDNIELNLLSAQLAKEVNARFPQLVGVTGDDFRNHPDRPRWRAFYDIETVEVPILVWAWAGDDADRPTPAEIMASSNAERVACLVAVLELNPDLAPELPGIADVLELRRSLSQAPNDPNA